MLEGNRDRIRWGKEANLHLRFSSTNGNLPQHFSVESRGFFHSYQNNPTAEEGREP